jgi:hypothetical protein
MNQYKVVVIRYTKMKKRIWVWKLDLMVLVNFEAQMKKKDVKIKGWEGTLTGLQKKETMWLSG